MQQAHTAGLYVSLLSCNAILSMIFTLGSLTFRKGGREGGRKGRMAIRRESERG